MNTSMMSCFTIIDWPTIDSRHRCNPTSLLYFCLESPTQYMHFPGAPFLCFDKKIQHQAYRCTKLGRKPWAERSKSILILLIKSSMFFQRACNSSSNLASLLGNSFKSLSAFCFSMSSVRRYFSVLLFSCNNSLIRDSTLNISSFKLWPKDSTFERLFFF